MKPTIPMRAFIAVLELLEKTSPGFAVSSVYSPAMDQVAFDGLNKEGQPEHREFLWKEQDGQLSCTAIATIFE